MTLALTTLSDLEEIRDLARRFCAGLDREDADVLRSVFWPDATDDHSWLFCGRAWDFVDMILPQRARVRPTLHVVSNHTIDVDAMGSRAAGEVYCVGFQFRHALAVPTTRVVVGRYLDEYEKREDEWRIIHRQYILEGTFVGAVPEARS